jgi:hypothetical protein
MARKPPPKKKTRKIPRVPTLAEQAAQIAAMSINPQLGSLNAAITDAEGDRLASIRAAEGLTKALAGMTAGDAAAARDAYAAAADRISGYTGQLTGAVRAAQEGAVAADGGLIRTLQTPGDLITHAGDNANVSAFLGGIPAQGLAREAANVLVNMQDRRLAAGKSLVDQGLVSSFQQQGEIGKLRQQAAEIESKRPGVVLEALMALRQQANQDRATNVQVGSLQLQMAKTVQEQAVAMTNLTGQVHVVRKGKVVNTGRVARGSDAYVQAQDASVSATNAAARNATTQARDLTNATGYLHVVQKGKVVNTGRKAPGSRAETARKSAAGRAAAKKGTTQRNRADAVKNMNDDLARASNMGAGYALQLRGEPVPNPRPGGYAKGRSGSYMLAPGKVSELGRNATTTNDPQKARYDSTFTYQSAYDQLYNYIGADTLRSRYGLSKQRVDTLIKKLLAGAGWAAPAVGTRRSGR